MYGNSPRANLTPLISSLLLDMEDGGGGGGDSCICYDKRSRPGEERAHLGGESDVCMSEESFLCSTTSMKQTLGAMDWYISYAHYLYGRN